MSCFSMLLACSVVLAIGCNDEEGPERDTREALVVGRMGAEPLTSTSGATLGVGFRGGSPAGSAEFAWATEDGRVSVWVQMPYAEIADGEVRAVLAPAAAAANAGVKAQLVVYGREMVGQQLVLRVAAGRMSGEVAALGLTFEGALVVRCAVQPSSGTRDGAEDPDFSTKECAIVKSHASPRP